MIPDNVIMNAPGCGDIDELQGSECDIIITKTCTWESQEGHPLPNYYYEDGNSYNCNGLQNYGFEYYYDKWLTSEKLMIISVVGTKYDLEKIFEFLTEKSINLLMDVPIIEINISCPNVNCSIDLKYISDLSHKYDIGLKLPPLFDEFDEMLEYIVNANFLYITCCNTIRSKSPEYLSQEYCGKGGKCLKLIAMDMIRVFSPHIRTFAAGGIRDVQDIHNYQKVGASGFCIGTYLKENGIECFKKFKIID